MASRLNELLDEVLAKPDQERRMANAIAGRAARDTARRNKLLRELREYRLELLEELTGTVFGKAAARAARKALASYLKGVPLEEEATRYGNNKPTED